MGVLLCPLGWGSPALLSPRLCPQDDEFSHLYTLVVRPDNTYEVKIDNARVESGSLEEDWDFLPPKKIKDPEAKKPDDWDERAKIDDPEDTKPEVGRGALGGVGCALMGFGGAEGALGSSGGFQGAVGGLLGSFRGGLG